MPEVEYSEIAKKMATELREVGKKLGEDYIPKLVRNTTVISLGAMTIYTLGLSLGAMLPSAVPVFVHFGILLGYVIPLMFMVMIMSLAVSIMKIMVRS